MLAIRMQRTGRRGHAQYRLIAQDSRFSPTSGRVVAFLGSYDPHTKVAAIDSEKVAEFLANGAQPSDRAAKLLKKEGVKLPDWVKISPDRQRAIKNPAKLRRNRPAEEPKPEPAAEPSSSEADEAPAADEAPTSEAPAEPETAPAQEVASAEEPASEPEETVREPETKPEEAAPAEEPAEQDPKTDSEPKAA